MTSTNVNVTPAAAPNFVDAQGNPMSDPTQTIPHQFSMKQRRRLRAHMKRVATAARIGVPVNSVGKYRAGRLITRPLWEAKMEQKRAARKRYKKARQEHFKLTHERDR